ncbi:MAG: Hsp70 family protein [Bacteroidetes bacterium]|nr:Hsp70 family protein [Bacteroidota bacterium]
MNKITLGIDLGTTYSAMAYVDENGVPKIIMNNENARTTPSVVFFESKNNYIVGQYAKDEIDFSPNNVVSFVKREIGKNKDEVRKQENYGEALPYDFFGKKYSPEEISSLILKKLKKDAEAHFQGKEITDVVITVPAYFNDFERNATIKAGELAGFNVLQVINEPTAAAIAYGIKSSINQKVFVFDLGGGTFDVTIIDIVDGKFSVIATDGDHRLGGKDWDDRIIDFISEEFINEFGEDPRDDDESMAELRLLSEKVKKVLSERNDYKLNFGFNGKKLRILITRDKFKELCADLLSRIEGLCNTILNQVNLNWSNISEIVLAGGSTRLLMVREMLEELSNKNIRTDLINPDECVAIGAAIQGNLLSSQFNRIGVNPKLANTIKSISDVASHSLGFVTVKDNALHNSIMINKNSEIPCKIVKSDFTTSRDNQDSLEVIVLQGESSNPNNCTILYGYEFQELPKKQKGKLNIEVSFEYNSNSVVQVTAKAENKVLPFKKLLEPKLPDLNTKIVEPLSVIIAIDLSGSMSGTPLIEAKAAALEFISQMNFENTRVALLPFADSVMVNQDFTQATWNLEDGINNWSIGMVGGANDAEPFQKSLEMMKYEQGKKLVIVLTDGVWSYQNLAITNAEKCKQNNIEIRAIGFGGADINFLKQLSSSEGGYDFTTSGAELTQAMLNIATEITTNKIK